MSLRLALLLLLLAPAVVAADPIKDAYRQAKRIRNAEKKKQFAAQHAARLAGQASGTSHLYMGLLWKYAERYGRAAESFKKYILQADGKAKNRPVAMAERARALLMSGQYGLVNAAAEEYLRNYPTGRYLGQVHFDVGRARRLLGQYGNAMASFEKSAMVRYEVAPYERLDCLVQLGRYAEAGEGARAKAGKGARYDMLARAAGNLGKKWPKLDFDNWTGRDLATSEVISQPVIFLFWLTKSQGRARDKVHDLGNRWAAKYKGKVLVCGPTLYTQFNPIDMVTDEGLAPAEEWDFVEGWYQEYKLQYPLCILNDEKLHEFCGVDPVRPALPAVAVGDRHGKLRHVRTIDGPWAAEAVEAMIAQILKE